jgi:hypothetical protein
MFYLLENDEAAQLELAQEGRFARSGAFIFVSFPIPDAASPHPFQTHSL